MSINALQISSSCAGFQWNSETKEIIFRLEFAFNFTFQRLKFSNKLHTIFYIFLFSGDNVLIVCKSQEIHKSFVIHSSDYDADVQGTPLSVTCEVTVSDGQLSDTASLVLHVNNINDNSPVFINFSYSYSVKVNASIGTLVGSVSAVDNDLGEYGKFLFYNFTV